MTKEKPAATELSSTERAAALILSGKSKKSGLARLLPFMGPAFIASVAYMDPGNFATNIQGGAQFGYTLLWVVVTTNLMAMLIQTLSAKLGIASGRNLAELCREKYSKPVVLVMWVLMEIVAIATDLAAQQKVSALNKYSVNLMLKESVVEAIQEGKFHVWPVSNIDEGIEVLTGIKAGERQKDGKFEPESINARVDQRLRQMAETLHRFGRDTGQITQEVEKTNESG